MIVTKNWLNEFAPIEDLSDQRIAETFISIGHEVASSRRVSFDGRVVIGEIVKKEKHPSADKLSVCEVDAGGKTLTIVCGAKNVEEGMFAPIALIGAKLPGGLEIKEAELRGVKSYGMICSATELGLGDLNDGILPLDSSIGDLVAGRKLSDCPLLADTIFEVELTANRGDCLSVLGLARELCAALNLSLRSPKRGDLIEGMNEIGHILRFVPDTDASASVFLRAIERSEREIAVPLLAKLRLKWAQLEPKGAIDSFCLYAAHASGVVFRAFDLKKIAPDRADLRVVKNGGFNQIVCGSEAIDTIGFDADRRYAADDQSRAIVLAAFFANPDEISRAAYEAKIAPNPVLSRLSKGAEPNVESGMRFLCETLSLAGAGRFYRGEISFAASAEEKEILASAEEISALIGAEIDNKRIADILRRLGADTKLSRHRESLAITPPAWRHDLGSLADISEEIVRIMGIASVPSKPLAQTAKRAISEGWKRWRFERDLASRSAAAGFCESIHFLFCDSAAVGEFGFKPVEKGLDIANPIAANLNALRPTLLINLLDAAAKNLAKGRRRAALFEIGDIYDDRRAQSREIAFVFCGEKEGAGVENHGKSPACDLFSFAALLRGVLGRFDLENADIPYLQNGQSARILIGKKPAGGIGKIAPKIALRLGLSAGAFAASVDIAAIEQRVFNAAPFSKLQPIERDLSVAIGKSTPFSAVREAIEDLAIAEIKQVFAIDTYEDKTLGDLHSLTIRLILQPLEKTLKDDEISRITDQVLERLSSRFKAGLR